MKNESRVMLAIARLRIIPFYPNDNEIVKAQIAVELDKMCETDESLEWLINQAINNLQEWKGIAWMRDRYCSRFKPADGVYPAGDEADAERDYIEREAAATQKRFAEWKREALALSAGEQARNQKLIEATSGQRKLAFPREMPGKDPEPVRKTSYRRPLSEIYHEERQIGPTPVRTEEQRREELEKLTRELSARRATVQ